MGKNFWPAYLIVASVLLAATWKFAPAIGEKLPQSGRDSIYGLVAKCLGRSTGGEADAQPRVQPPAAEPSRRKVEPQSAGAPKRAPAAPAQVAVAPKRVPAAPAQVAVAPKHVATPPPPPPPAAAEDDELPSLKGITQEDPDTARWGVLNQATVVEGLDGEEKGAVAGGRIFLIESREKRGTKLWLIGNFSPTPMAEPVRVPATSLYCFSGNPDKLSQNQRNCLRMYYQLRGEAIACKNKVLRENADMSPYGRRAAQAKKAFDAKARAVEASSSGDNPRVKNELSQLREKYTALLEKHREWKKANASRLKDPDQDPAYLKKLQEARAYAGPIAGMAF